MKKVILEGLHHLLSCNVIGDKQYDNRYKGFNGELDFSNWFSQNRNRNNLFTGGYLIPREEKSNTLKNPVYVTISAADPNQDYKNIYHLISTISPQLFFIQFSNDQAINQWNKADVMGHNIPLPTPEFQVYQYDKTTMDFKLSSLQEFLSLFTKRPKRNKNTYPISEETKQKHIHKLQNHHQNDLLDLYVQRLIFDGYIGFGRLKGIPSDIDAIIKKENGSYIFLEVKEKDKSKRYPQGFGMDLNRIKSLMTISKETMTEYYYLVREVDNQYTRNFVGWKIINIKNFSRHVELTRVIEGGTGMRLENSNNPTKICPYEYFKDLSS